MNQRLHRPPRVVAKRVFIRRWLPVLAWMGLIFFLSSRETLPHPRQLSPDLQAISGHFTVYAVLAFLLFRALGADESKKHQQLLTAFIIAVLYGISDEFHQSFVPGRVPDIFDVATDAVGALVGLLLARRMLTKTRRWSGMANQTGQGDQSENVR